MKRLRPFRLILSLAAISNLDGCSMGLKIETFHRRSTPPVLYEKPIVGSIFVRFGSSIKLPPTKYSDCLILKIYLNVIIEENID